MLVGRALAWDRLGVLHRFDAGGCCGVRGLARDYCIAHCCGGRALRRDGSGLGGV